MTRRGINPISHLSLMVQPLSNGQPLGTATAFITIDSLGQPHLITNWHVLAGRNAETGEILHSSKAIPEELSIRFHTVPGELQLWTERRLPLLDGEGQPLWRQHPRGRDVDIAALQLPSALPGVVFFLLHPHLAQLNIGVDPGTPVSIVGFPYAQKAAGGWPIWKTGHVATDVTLNFDHRPVFLVDATTRASMSGSPVYAVFPNGYTTPQGGINIDGMTHYKFLGVYSGRIASPQRERGEPDIELGRVFKAESIWSMLE